MKISDKLKKRLKRWLLIVILLSAVAIGWVAFFFVFNQAPILQGEVEYDIAYNDEQSLDIYLPIEEKYDKRPVLVFFHGGAWIAGMKEAININRYNEAINELREEGYAVVSPGYTLAGELKSPFPDCLLDAYDALHWIEEHAEQYKLDVNNVGLMGESAGAHIAMMAAYAPRDSFFVHQSLPDIKYVIDVYGPTELESVYYSQTYDSLKSLLSKVPDPIANNIDFTLDLFGFDPKTDTLRARHFMQRFSPLLYLNDTIPPTLIIHGTNDKIVPEQQSLVLKNKMEEMSLTYEFHELSGMGHAFRGATRAQKDSTQRWIVDFVRGYYSELN